MSNVVAWFEGLPVWLPYLLIAIALYWGRQYEKGIEALERRLDTLETRLGDLDHPNDNDDETEFFR